MNSREAQRAPHNGPPPGQPDYCRLARDESRHSLERPGSPVDASFVRARSAGYIGQDGQDGSCVPVDADHHESASSFHGNDGDITMLNLDRFQSRASTLIDRPYVLTGQSGDAPDDEPRHHKLDMPTPGPSGGATPTTAAADDGQLLYIAKGDKKFQPPWFLLGPSVAVLLLTAGLATIMVVWIQTHRLPLESEGVIFVREGVEDEPDRPYTNPSIGRDNELRFNTQIAHSTGLSFSTVISTVAGASIYPYMALIAYSLATDWLILQARVAESPSAALREKLPTPMQYALLLQLCSSQSLEAVWNTLRHIFLDRGSRATVPGLLKKAVTWLIVLLLVNTAIAWTDFWLHETVKIVQIVHVDPQSEMRGYGTALNTTLCPELELSQGPDAAAPLPCLVSIDPTTGQPTFAEGPDLESLQVRSEGSLTFEGLSTTHAVDDLSLPEQTSRLDRLRMRFSPSAVAKNDSLVFATAPGIDGGQIFHMPTIGLETECQMIATSCAHDPTSFDCTNAGYPEIRSELGLDLAARLQLVTLADRSQSAADGSTHVAFKPANPIRVGVVTSYMDSNTSDVAGTGFETMQQSQQGGGGGSVHFVYSIAVCSLSFYELDVDFFNSTFSLRGDRRLAPDSLAFQLSGPLVSGRVGRTLGSALSAVTGRLEGEHFAAELGYTLGYALLSEASGLLAPVDVAVLQSERVLASQYPVVALYFYFGLLYSYALVALILFAWAWSSSSDSVAYDCPRTGRRVEMPAATLAQRVLMDPGRLIASHLGGNQTHAHGATLASVATMLAHAAPGVGGTNSEKAGIQDSATSTGVQAGILPLNRQAVLRTTATDMLDLFDEPVHQERLVIGLETGGRGFGVWPVSQATGAVGQAGGGGGRSGKRDSLIRASNLLHHPLQNHQQHCDQPVCNRDQDQDFAPAGGRYR
ncbi:uncharacterized protein PFL1_01351 [Pseudozyma flocculosa PF-1]|uniref:Uncharacterized protein n=1 Tax=Pseudozyma flocculosa TaxID=84751 RepID=A0A5C3EVQ3_9BASI|nr:uncharacterized protein PFL1_01351 [Pseudozyma flocculosa PF-1]EPQ31163.1 hypothetical protein PFL1_01351 [Pseudozyma flocculosa PF-1]SPO36344.1 uncharacterized protein PSFLO_01815 [Pseudozyma flocculosa]